MRTDQHREVTCPNCGEDHKINIIYPKYFICVCGKPLGLMEDVIDGSLRYLLEVLPDEESEKWKILDEYEPYFQDFISFNDDNQK